jgi:hypothetical protein
MPKRKAAGAGSDDDDGDEEYVPDLDDVKAARVDRHDDDGDTRPKGGSAIKAIPKKSSSKKPTAVTTKHTSANIWTRLEAAGFKRREAFFFSSGSGMCAAAAIVKARRDNRVVFCLHLMLAVAGHPAMGRHCRDAGPARQTC